MDHVYIGPRRAGSLVTWLLQVVDALGVPSEADSPPTFAIYGATDEVLATGTAEPFDSDTLTGVYKMSLTLDGRMAVGTTYAIHMSWVVDAEARAAVFYFTVV